MPTGAGKQGEARDHWQARDAVWASWGDQEAYDKKMAETKDRRDAARTVHEAKQEKKLEELEAVSSTPHVAERQEKVSERNVRNCDLVCCCWYNQTTHVALTYRLRLSTRPPSARSSAKIASAFPSLSHKKTVSVREGAGSGGSATSSRLWTKESENNGRCDS